MGSGLFYSHKQEATQMSGETSGINIKSSQITDLDTAVPQVVPAPATASSAGVAGQIAYDATHI